MSINQPIKAFTVIELLISMTLTGILVAFSFMGFNQMQRLFNDYNQQTAFIAEMNQLHSALFYLSNRSASVEQVDDKTILFSADSVHTKFILNDKTMLLQFPSHTDTFHFEPKEITFDFMVTKGQLTSKLVKRFDCDVFFRNQKFHVSFRKQFDSQQILKSTLELQAPDELN